MVIGQVREIWRYPVKSMGGERLGRGMVECAGVVGDRMWAVRDETAGEMRGAKHLPKLLLCTARYRTAPGAATIPPVQIRFPDGTQVGSDDPDVHARLSGFLDRRVSLWPLQPATDRSHYRRADRGAPLLAGISRSRLLRPHLSRVLRYGGQDRSLRAVFGREPDEPLPDLSTLPPEVLEFTSPPGTYFDVFPLHLLTTASLGEMARLNPGADWHVQRFRPNLVIATRPGIEGFVEAAWGSRAVHVGDLVLRCEGPTVRCSMTMHEQPGLPRDSTILRTIVREAGQNLGVYATPRDAGEVAVGDAVTLSVE